MQAQQGWGGAIVRQQPVVRGLLVVIALLLYLGPAPVRAETVGQAYETALKDYYAGRYKEAVDGFQRILAIPLDNADVHYNLGCAYFRLSKLGPAIYHFEKTLLLDASDEDARFNLETTRSLVAAKIKDEIKGATDESWWVRLVRPLGQHTWAIIFLILWWLALGLVFSLRFIHPGPVRAGIVASSSLLGGLTLLGGLLLAARIYLDIQVPMGIVIPDQLAVREGPDASTKVSFTLHAGLRVRLRGQENGWRRIRLPNGLEGWVSERQIGVL